MLHKLHAHSLLNRPPDEWQPLDVHLAAVAARAAQFASAFQSADWAWNAGWLHDLGKAAPEFQNYLREQNGLDGLDDPQYDASGLGRINHSSPGAAFAKAIGQLDEDNALSYRALSYVVAGHHAGLTDFYEDGKAGRGSLRHRREEDDALRKNIPAISVAEKETLAQLRPLSDTPALLAKDPKRAGFHLWLRMLFSCLTDADFLDTEEFMNPGLAAIRAKYPDLAELGGVVTRY